MLLKIPRIREIYERADNKDHRNYVEANFPKMSPFLEGIATGATMVVTQNWKNGDTLLVDGETGARLIREGKEKRTGNHLPANNPQNLLYVSPDIQMPQWTITSFGHEISVAWSETSVEQKRSVGVASFFSREALNRKGRTVYDIFSDPTACGVNLPKSVSLGNIARQVGTRFGSYYLLVKIKKKTEGDNTNDDELVANGIELSSIKRENQVVIYNLRQGVKVNHPDIDLAIDSRALEISQAVKKIGKILCLGVNPNFVDAMGRRDEKA